MSAPLLAREVAAAVAPYVTDVVLCPGSRNSALTLALLARRDLRVHVRIDERSAAFLALGMARQQRRPVAVVMTSGTAVANCLPAVIEAAQSHVPLVVLSADRPRALVGTGASQTIDQVGLFGSYAPTVQVEAPEDMGQIHQALADFPQVHLNVAFDIPLVPEALPAREGEAHRLRPTRTTEVDHGEVEVDLSRPTLVIAGDEAWEVEELAEVPTIAEPSAPTPFHPVHPLAAHLLIGTIGGQEGVESVTTKPEQVIVVGHPTLHRPVLALLEDPEVEVTVLSRTATITDPGRHARRVASRVKATGQTPQRWYSITQAASEMGAQAVREAVSSQEHGFTGLHVAAAVADSVAVGDSLFLAASNAVRDASFVGLPFSGVDTHTPRGAAGIDGTVSQAVGVALAAQAAEPDAVRAPRTVGLLGDLALLHDAGGMLIGPMEPRPENLTLVVANDDGGGIFETLEMGAPALRDSFERGFGTPHGARIEDLCAAYGVDYARAESLPELLAALDESEEAGGFRVIEARTRRDTRRDLHAALERAVRVRQ
ncbi:MULTISPECIES: 2-succinyl-5-enolpyruvyl-6-hydroxy-3-cyclohexene-1-carboxylic-acid synthase [unclassified Corynebacterium]|uniref:2-succinyl-5-enolpyruvyl-6-hydroxy-3- cyclohexene-1-carboxylic-acid synthase n=1 Tax=unclassified Corynebacterium TaxID=2624378 RepID=UPI0029CA8368|nr:MULTISPECIES: 2-succinyl-5-enolpyruvyl-6-hydroxy-3-cyclohexene-1-carboxylic-acid synthase [unclassified Corynebacterium]WPF66439.1 2-succinyl-5-enolpyruvyl-6-hydroxy-3-cyclohexene-1-carboxylic-acid synthase [Corynebacterium sp. 22KM0430]WPF68929.1 2-succinyl-5-enolpyruvyl-6-hydroxy-3-cyclohexene-1-carboxylic-acid synthase [Corynebacterium sp. 21KM1197]